MNASIADSEPARNFSLVTLRRTDISSTWKHDVCLSLPTVVDRRGIVSVLAPPVSDDEQAALTRSAAAVRSVASSLGL